MATVLVRLTLAACTASLCAIAALAPAGAASHSSIAQQVLTTAAKRSLRQNSFTVQQTDNGHVVGEIVYQSPNRTEYAANTNTPTIVIDKKLYEPATITQSGKVTKWWQGPLAAIDDRIYGPLAARLQLGWITHTSTVVLDHGQFHFQEKLPLGEVSPGSKGSVLVKGSVSVANGLVTKLSLNYVLPGVVTPSERFTYSSYNASPDVTAPPASEVQQRRPCLGSPGQLC